MILIEKSIYNCQTIFNYKKEPIQIINKELDKIILHKIRDICQQIIKDNISVNIIFNTNKYIISVLIIYYNKKRFINILATYYNYQTIFKNSNYKFLSYKKEPIRINKELDKIILYKLRAIYQQPIKDNIFVNIIFNIGEYIIDVLIAYYDKKRFIKPYHYTLQYCPIEGNLINIIYTPKNSRNVLYKYSWKFDSFINAMSINKVRKNNINEQILFNKILQNNTSFLQIQNIWLNQETNIPIEKHQYKKPIEKPIFHWNNILIEKHQYKKPIYHPFIDLQIIDESHNFIKIIYHPLCDYAQQQIIQDSSIYQETYVLYPDLKIILFGNCFTRQQPRIKNSVELVPHRKSHNNMCDEYKESPHSIYEVIIDKTQQVLYDRIAYKICYNTSKQYCLVILKLLKNESKLVMGKGPKFRTNICVPIQIFEFINNVLEEYKDICYSTHNSTFTYKINHISEESLIDMSKHIQCSKGIHFFLDIYECLKYWNIKTPQNINILDNINNENINNENINNENINNENINNENIIRNLKQENMILIHMHARLLEENNKLKNN